MNFVTTYLKYRGELFGLNATQSKAAVTNNCKAAISHGRKCFYFYGTIVVNYFPVVSS